MIIVVNSQVGIVKQTWSSSPFPHQETKDRQNDWILRKNINDNFSMPVPDGGIFSAKYSNDPSVCQNSPDNKFPKQDISAVTYYSDGKLLNIVLWLDSVFKEPKLNTSLSSLSSFGENLWHKMGYTLSFDILSANDLGTDYYLEIAWDVVNQTWTRTLSEGASIGEKRVLYQERNYTDFFENNRKYLSMPLNLSEVSSPDQYRIILSAWDNFPIRGQICSFIDLTNWIYIPPPEYVMSTKPTSTILRPGDEANIELQIKSASKLKSYVFLSAEKADGMELTFLPSRIYVPPHGTTASLLHIKALQNVEIRSYTLPITAKILFPSEAKLRNSTDIVSNSLLGGTQENLDLVVEVLKPFTIEDKMSNFYNTWFTPITGMYIAISGIVAGLLPSILKIYRNMKKKNKN
ncbi:MAG TPA: hypothetical protein VJS91_01075 [Nitrososphaeraceae archaeon]|nr:hypothetical protein [Nitrososphaeraceae archaeon]